MKYIIFSDIHGNYRAFNQLLTIINSSEIDVAIFCGDVLGYYYHADEIISKIRNNPKIISVVGNHDKNYLQALKDKKLCNEFVTKYGEAYTLPISESNKQFISQLPESLNLNIDGKQVLVFHGSPSDNTNGRIYPDTILSKEDLDVVNNYDIVFAGHTHYKMVKRIRNALIINPGSLGQPRDGRGFSYCVFDFAQMKYEFCQVTIDTQSIIKEVDMYERLDERKNRLKSVLERKNRRLFMEKNLFVTAVGGDIACATLRCIRRHYSCHHIVGCDVIDYVQGKDYVDTFILAPRYDNEEKYLDFVIETCLKYDITHFLPMTEAEILIAHRNRGLFKKNGILLMINNNVILEVALSKYNTAKYLSSIGITAPKTFNLNEYENQLNYPLVVKADNGRGSKDVAIVSNDEEYLSAISQIKHPIIQEYIGTKDEEYTMGIFSDGEYVKSITFKRTLGFGGMSIRVEYVEDEKLTCMAEKIAQNMNLVGSINAQMRKENGEYYIFEINPRLSSTVGFRDLFGFTDAIWWLNVLDSDKPNLDVNIRRDLIGIKTLNEAVYSTTETIEEEPIYTIEAQREREREREYHSFAHNTPITPYNPFFISHTYCCFNLSTNAFQSEV